MKRFMKKGLALILLAAMIGVLLPENLGGVGFAWAEDEHTHVDENGETFQPWDSSDSLPTTQGNYYLTKDVEVSSDWTAPDGEIRICLNGYSVTKTGTGTYCSLNMTGTNELFIYDCADEEECGSIYGIINVKEEASVTVNGGGIFRPNNSGIKIWKECSGTVTVNGGIIGGEEADIGIECFEGSNGLVTINGGKIQGRNGLQLYGGKAIMTDGIITDNGRSSSNKGVWIKAGAQFEMSGGTLCVATANTTAIWINSTSGVARISGGTVESKDGNAISNEGTLEVSGGTIKSINSLGLYNQAGAKTVIKGGTISSSHSNGVSNVGMLEIEGGTIEGGKIEGGSAYFSLFNSASGSVTISGGTIVHSATHSIKNAGTMTVSGGTIESSSKAGLYNAGGTLTVTGGTISGVTYGVQNEAVFQLSGNPEITGGTVDIYLSNGKFVTISGALTGAYRVGMEKVGVFTDTADENKELNKESCFTAAKPLHTGYAVRKNADGQLELFYVPETYTISYNPGQYGEGEIEPDSREEGAASISLSSETFTRKCYTQKGWATEDGGEKAYDLGGEYAEDANITLYPYWGDAEHTFVTDAAVEPTCTGTGLTEGSHCSVCGTVLVEQETVAALGHDPDDTWHADEKEHYHICRRSGCGEKVDAVDHTSGDWIVDREATTAAEGSRHKECTVCGEVLETETIPKEEDVNAGRVDKEVQSDENAPDASLPMDKDELADAVLDEDEKQAVENGTDIKIVLNVKDASESVSAETKRMVGAAIEKAPEAYTVGQYLDISLMKIISISNDTMTQGVETTNEPILITITIPENMKGEGNRTFAILRVHGEETDILEDRDTDPDTITIETDRFSTYVLIYQEEDNQNQNDKDKDKDKDKDNRQPDDQSNQNGSGNGSQTDDSNSNNGAGQNANTTNTASGQNAAAKTGDMSHVEIYATLAMIAGLACIVLCLRRRERGMTEK